MRTITDNSVYAAKGFVLAGREGGQITESHCFPYSEGGLKWLDREEGGRKELTECQRERVWGRSSSPGEVIGPWGVASRGAKRKRAA